MAKYQPIPISQSLTVSPERSRALQTTSAMASVEPHGIVDLWYQILAAKWTLFSIVGICVLFALLAGLLQTPLYRAQTSLEIQDMNDKFMDLKALDPTDTSNYGSESYIQTQIRIAQSRALIERTLSHLPAAEKARLVEASRLRSTTLTDEQLIQKISSRFDARPSRQARIIDLTFDSPDPVAGADFVNTLAQELSEFTLERRWKTSQRTREWLERQLGDFRSKLEQSEKELQDYARDSGLLFTSEKNNVSEAKLLQVQEELSRAQADRMTKQANYDRVSQSDSDALPEVISDYTLRELHVRLADLKRQLAEMQSIYTPQHPAVLKVRAQVNEMQAIFDRRKASLVGQIKNEYEAALGRERLIQSNFAVQSHLVSGQSEKSVHYSVLKREVEANRQLYDSMMTRMKEAGVASAIRASNILVIDPAFPDKKKTSPNLPFNAALGGLVGTMIGCVYILFRDRISNTFATPGVMTRYLEVPELGAIPTDEYLRQLSVFSPGRQSSSLQLAFDKRSASAESYRAIRSSILYQVSDRKKVRSLVFTSSVPGEGKTTVVGNLGAAMAAANRRVLVIDADLRKPRLHEVLGAENYRGLVELLSGDNDSPVVFDPAYILDTPVPGLSLLTAGQIREDSPELLSSDRLPKLIRELSKCYDLVLIDTPPVLPYSDARNLGRVADGVVLIVRAEETDRRAVLMARDLIQQDRIPLLGTILTDWNAKKNTFDYYRTYRTAVWEA